MPELPDLVDLQRQWQTLQVEHPQLEPLAALVLVALRRSDASTESGVSSALLSRRLGIEHALIRRAATELESGGWILTRSAGGASPALRLILLPVC
ncbi:hypothetical protein R5R73_02980 [Salinicola sp. LHM]|uniref:hypothetical protein n=1 Tax=Salinicola sp. LHM TaxID=3065298 RepID=UPI002ACD43EC|nr:hypothetical protein [Salinicola sp. LHM]WQH33661.1 hypothetical protein R5R73_02980 [Salinicola sp. LHM]